jgi:pimeloyl-ACP methyl ester carboxylesterase
MTPENWYETGTITPLLEHEIFYVEQGASDKPTLLLIHGFPTAGWDWHGIMPGLTDFHVLVPDLLGYGFSAKPWPHDYSTAEQADLIEALLEHKGIGRYHILAHDYGDTVAQELLARDNERAGDQRIRSVALLNGGLFPEATRPRLIQKLMLGPLGPVMVKLVSRRTLRRNMHAIFGPDTSPSEALIDAFWYLIEFNQGRRVFHGLIQYIRERDTYRERWLDALRQTPARRVLINGSADPISGAHLAARYGELIDAREVVSLPDIGHYPQVEAPQEVLRHYLAFV